MVLKVCCFCHFSFCLSENSLIVSITRYNLFLAECKFWLQFCGKLKILQKCRNSWFFARFVAYCAHFQRCLNSCHIFCLNLCHIFLLRRYFCRNCAFPFSSLSLQIQRRDKRLTLLFQFLRRSTLPICEQLLGLGSSCDCQGNFTCDTCVTCHMSHACQICTQFWNHTETLASNSGL